MLEVRYNTDTKKLTAWCGDATAFGNLEREGHTVIILDIPIPNNRMETYLYDDTTQSLMNNPDYIEPEPARDLATRVSKLEAKIEILEKK